MPMEGAQQKKQMSEEQPAAVHRWRFQTGAPNASVIALHLRHFELENLRGTFLKLEAEGNLCGSVGDHVDVLRLPTFPTPEVMRSMVAGDG
jgi:hypothetical protein